MVCKTSSTKIAHFRKVFTILFGIAILIKASEAYYATSVWVQLLKDVMTIRGQT